MGAGQDRAGRGLQRVACPPFPIHPNGKVSHATRGHVITPAGKTSGLGHGFIEGAVGWVSQARTTMWVVRAANFSTAVLRLQPSHLRMNILVRIYSWW